MNKSDKFFPKSSRYSPELAQQNSVGGNVLYSTEALAEELKLKKGTRVLDLGCGKALSSSFLAKEYNVKVWCVDNYFSSASNLKLIKKLKCEDSVFPFFCDVRNLPFEDNFFDYILSVNSYSYFGTDDKFLPYISRFLKPGGRIGITDICFKKEINKLSATPHFLKNTFSDYWYHIHSPLWWKYKWEKTKLVTHLKIKYIDNNNIIKNEYINYHIQDPGEAFAQGLRKDVKNTITFFMMTGTRSSKASFLETNFE